MNNNKNAVLHVWMLPLLFVLGCFAASYMAGSLDYRNIVDERSQRDFNAALGMPLMIGFLWLSIRILHKRAAKRLADFLVQINQLNTFVKHTRELEKRLIKHTVISVSLAIVITTTYLFVENLLAYDQGIDVWLLNVIAVPFWFFISLFIMQSASFTRYLHENLVSPHINEHFCHCKPLCDLGVSNAMFGVMMFTLFPLFWIGKTIPLLDLLILSAIAVAFLVFLFMPVIKTMYLMRKRRYQKIKEIEHKIAVLIVDRQNSGNTRTGNELYALNQRLEDIKQYRCWPKDFLSNTKVYTVSTGLPCMCLFVLWFFI